MAETTEAPTDGQVESLQRLHWAANDVIKAFVGTRTARAAYLVSDGARRKLVQLHGARGGAV